MRLNSAIPLPFSEASVHAKMRVKNALDDPKSVEGERLKSVMNEFESLLLEQMLKEMQNTVPQSELFGASRGQEIFNEMLHGEYARLMENRGGIGLAQFMLDRMGQP